MKYRPVKLEKYGGDWLPLAFDTYFLSNAKNIAMGWLINDDSRIAAGVMNVEKGSINEFYVYEVSTIGWLSRDGVELESFEAPMNEERKEHCCSACGIDYSVYTALLEAGEKLRDALIVVLNNIDGTLALSPIMGAPIQLAQKHWDEAAAKGKV